MLFPLSFSHYYIDVKTRTYSEGGGDVMIGIPDGAVYHLSIDFCDEGDVLVDDML
jgi:hypothetical protein